MKTKMRLPKERRILLIGGGDDFRLLIGKVVESSACSVEFGVMCDPAMDSDSGTRESKFVAALCEEADIPLMYGADVTAASAEDWCARHGFNVAVVFGWRRVIGQSFLDRFDGRVLNVHTGELPRHRGAGGFTWQVLMGETDAVVSVHQMSAALDTGAVVFKRRRRLPDGPIYPQTIMTSCRELLLQEVFSKLIADLLGGRDLELTPQGADRGRYFPMLYTPNNGLLDFSWDVDAAVTFVRAFSYPYPGASFCYGDKMFRAREAIVRERDDHVHPFVHGLVADSGEVGIDVFLDGGVVRLQKIVDEQGQSVSASQFRPGGRLYNESEKLLMARKYRHRHGVS